MLKLLTERELEVIKVAITNYVKTKIERTECLQKNFKQKCNYCKYYTGCILYSKYVAAWIELQKYKGE